MTEGTVAAPAHTTCAIVGGGPAGIVLGLLLARAGIAVTVLEKHADFLRDFRGDTVHPATLGLLDDLGLFARFDALPHSKIRRAYFPGREGTDVFADFRRLPVRHPYIAMVPQWDLLDLLAEAAATEPTFTLLREHEVTTVTRRDGRVTGVAYRSPSGDGLLTADLVVGCDGRWSTVRRSVGLPVREIPVPFDVWWYRLTSDRHLDESLLPRVRDGKVAIGIPRRGYVQVAALGRKGTDAEVRARGIDAFRADAATLFPELADAAGRIASMDEVKHLDVRLERLSRWHANNVLCIGDAAHAMSPVGGVGINSDPAGAGCSAGSGVAASRRSSSSRPSSGSSTHASSCRACSVRRSTRPPGSCASCTPSPRSRSSRRSRSGWESGPSGHPTGLDDPAAPHASDAGLGELRAQLERLGPRECGDPPCRQRVDGELGDVHVPPRRRDALPDARMGTAAAHVRGDAVVLGHHLDDPPPPVGERMEEIGQIGEPRLHPGGAVGPPHLGVHEPADRLQVVAIGRIDVVGEPLVHLPGLHRSIIVGGPGPSGIRPQTPHRSRARIAQESRVVHSPLNQSASTARPSCRKPSAVSSRATAAFL